MTLSQMIDKPTPGNAVGTCYLCGIETQTGHAEKPSTSFTAWSQCFSGDVICEYCYTMLKERVFRCRSWMATADGVRFATKDDREWLLPAMLNPPEPPFAFYVTVAYQKQGWLSLLNRVSHSREHYWCGVDFAEASILLHTDAVIEYSALLDTLRKHEIAKVALAKGVYTPHHYKRAMDAGCLDDLERARQLAGNSAWEVIVNVHQ